MCRPQHLILTRARCTLVVPQAAEEPLFLGLGTPGVLSCLVLSSINGAFIVYKLFQDRHMCKQSCHAAKEYMLMLFFF